MAKQGMKRPGSNESKNKKTRNQMQNRGEEEMNNQRSYNDLELVAENKVNTKGGKKIIKGNKFGSEYTNAQENEERRDGPGGEYS